MSRTEWTLRPSSWLDKAKEIDCQHADAYQLLTEIEASIEDSSIVPLNIAQDIKLLLDRMENTLYPESGGESDSDFDLEENNL